MKVNNKYIGVFDSGVGGLTCLKALKEEFKNENFFYLGDTLRCPYGVKKKEEIEKIVESDIKYLERRDVKMIIIACNTATANSYHIKSNIPIIRIIKPTCDIVNQLDGTTAILATNYTINSKAYERFLTGDSIGVPCSEWVELIEAGKTKCKESKESVERLLKDVKGKVKNVILGCTHFGLLEDEIREYLGDVRIINSSTSLSDTVRKCLDEVGYNNGNQQDIKINVTGNPKTLNISWFTDEELDIKEVNIDD